MSEFKTARSVQFSKPDQSQFAPPRHQDQLTGTGEPSRDSQSAQPWSDESFPPWDEASTTLEEADEDPEPDSQLLEEFTSQEEEDKWLSKVQEAEARLFSEDAFDVRQHWWIAGYFALALGCSVAVVEPFMRIFSVPAKTRGPVSYRLLFSYCIAMADFLLRPEYQRTKVNDRLVTYQRGETELTKIYWSHEGVAIDSVKEGWVPFMFRVGDKFTQLIIQVHIRAKVDTTARSALMDIKPRLTSWIYQTLLNIHNLTAYGMPPCSFCQQTPLNRERCVGCQKVVYCSADCKQNHEPAHRSNCFPHPNADG